MGNEIERRGISSGRMMKEDDDVINVAEIIEALAGKIPDDPATQTTLAAVLAKLTADPATQTTLAAVLAALQGTLNVALSGRIPEYGWLDTDDEPTPLEPTKFAVGVEINTTTHEMTTKYWTGSAWQEVL